MFKQKAKVHSHNFKVVWYTTEARSLVQMLYCKLCDKHFIGYGGKLHSPLFIHEMKHQINIDVLQAPHVIDKIGTITGKNEK